MNLPSDRRLLLAGGAGAALLAGVAIGTVFMARDKPSPSPVSNTTEARPRGALQVQLGDQPRLDPNRPLRCFVKGQFVGDTTLADCAGRNGIAAQALDVGLDQSGALAAGGEAMKPIAPPPPPTRQIAQIAPPAQIPTSAPAGECLRYGADGWRPAGGALSLSACVQALFAGHCSTAGEADYGRWSGQTLRLVPGKVEASPDNRTFHTLAEQARDCSIPSI